MVTRGHSDLFACNARTASYFVYTLLQKGRGDINALSSRRDLLQRNLEGICLKATKVLELQHYRL